MRAPAAITSTLPVDALPEFLTPEEFRAYVRIGRSAMYDLLRRGEIPHVKFGRLIRIPKSVLQSARAEVE
jgi:excisionase family DNA binding protein